MPTIAENKMNLGYRGRFLYSQTYGLDPFRNYSIDENTTVNGSRNYNYLEYPDHPSITKGFIYNNHKTHFGELDIEAVLSLDGLGKNGNIFTGIYGGIGIGVYSVNTDQGLDANQDYKDQYASIDFNGSNSSIRKSLKNQILDRNFETKADGFQDSKIQAGFMPSIGLEAGINLSPRFSAGFGHRVTFTGNDILDGEKWENPNHDILHYTNLFLRWKVRDRKQGTPPRINVVYPDEDPWLTTMYNLNLKAIVKGVHGSQDIRITNNNSPVQFNFYHEELQSGLLLQPGSNKIKIRATNPYGSDEEDVLIIVQEKEKILPPKIIISNPRTKTSRTENEHITIRARILNINSRRQIKVKLENQIITNFDFDQTTGNFNCAIQLMPGNNRFRIEAENRDGKDIEEIFIDFEPRRMAPDIEMLQPPSSRIVTHQTNIPLEARIYNIVEKDQIRLYINGRRYSDFHWNSEYQSFTASLHLIPGEYEILLSAFNDVGEDQEIVEIVVELLPPPESKPKVEITFASSPVPDANNGTFCTSIIKARIENIESKNQVEFTINGKSNRNFIFNARRNYFESQVKLKEGNNILAIKVSNPAGSDKAEINLVCQPEPKKPEVRFIQPPRDIKVSKDEYEILVEIKNIERKRQIQLYSNKKQLSSFDFNVNKEELTALIPLAEGMNRIKVSARNEDGQDEKSVIIEYERQKFPPAIHITYPKNGSTIRKGRVKLEAQIENVSTKGNITLFLNGRKQSVFTFQKEKLESMLTLKEGRNTILVKAENRDGKDEQQVIVSYKKETPPEVQITNPITNALIKNAGGIKFFASTKNISTKSQVYLSLNSAPYPEFRFRDNKVTATLALIPGLNQIRIRVMNDFGSAEDRVDVRYEPLPKPTIKFIQPAQTGTSTFKSSFLIKAEIKNVTSKRDIKFKINGRSSSTFSFNSKNGLFESRINLDLSTNTISINAVNKSGTAFAESKIIYVEMAPPMGDKPVVEIVSVSRPTINPLDPEKGRSTVIARISHQSDLSKIYMKGNGVYQRRMEFVSSTGILKHTFDLVKGRNTVIVGATNENGKDEKSTNIDF